MHIPDGYLSPATSATLYAAAAPFWYLAARRVRRSLTQRTVPVLALFAAFTFVLMMFNIPLPGGTTGHAVGGTLLAIVLGPWAAVIGLSVVLGVQALFFGDGGLMTLGANCFNMAIVLPLVGYFIYRAISGRSQPASPRRLLGAVAGSYTAIVVAAIFTGIELGLQPVLSHSADGTPLYAPYHLGVALPAMLIGHLLVAGPVEALVTGLVFGYLQRSRSILIGSAETSRKGGRLWPVWGALAVLALLTPLGIIASGTAWGEWSVAELTHAGLGFVPQGLARIEGWWPAPLPDYGLARGGAAIGYMISALLGMAVVGFLLWLLGRWLGRRSSPSQQTARTAPSAAAGEGFLTRTVSGISGALESGMTADNMSRAPGLLQGLDARVKAATFVLFIVVVGLTRSLPVLGSMAALAFLLSLLSRLPAGFFLKRVLLFLPFTVVIALPALFITPGEPLARLGGIALTQQGVRTGAFLALRVLDSVAFGGLLILTTPWNKFLAALRWMRLPSLVVDVLGMTYRYIFLLLHTANSMFLARRSRTVGRLPAGENRGWLGRTGAAMLSKSQHLSEEVYQAMLSRGYGGEIVVLGGLRWRRRDLAWASFAVLASSFLLWRSML